MNGPFDEIEQAEFGETPAGYDFHNWLLEGDTAPIYNKPHPEFILSVETRKSIVNVMNN